MPEGETGAIVAFSAVAWKSYQAGMKHWHCLAPPNAPTWEVGTKHRELDSAAKLWRDRYPQLHWHYASARKCPTHNSPIHEGRNTGAASFLFLQFSLHTYWWASTPLVSSFPALGTCEHQDFSGESMRQDHTDHPLSPCGTLKFSDLLYQIVKHISLLLPVVCLFQ